MNWILVGFVQRLFAIRRGIVGVCAVSVGVIIEWLLRAGESPFVDPRQGG